MELFLERHCRSRDTPYRKLSDLYREFDLRCASPPLFRVGRLERTRPVHRCPEAVNNDRFIFIGLGVADFTHFIFQLLKPALDPTLPAITATVSSGRLVAEMPNYW